MKKLFALAFSVLLFAATTDTSFAAYGVQAKTSGCVANTVLPDSGCTPGAILTTSVSTICVSGYTKTVRDVPLSERKKVFAEYGIPYSSRSNYEVDHLVSLELGGSNDIANLWPESRTITDGSLVKDKLENYLHAQVCSGKMTIQDAQTVIATNWPTAYSAMLKASATKTSAVVQQKKKTPTPISAPVQQTKTVVQTSPPLQPSTPVNPPVSQPQPAESPIPVVQAPSPIPVAPPIPQQAPKQSPATQAPDSRPTGATARCGDGSFSFSTSRSGTCSHHGGVMQWY